MRRPVIATAFLVLGSTGLACAEEPPPPPPPPTPPFADAFDDATALPRAWTQSRGAIAVVDAPDARSGGRVLRAQSVGKHLAATLAKDLPAPAANATALTCTFAVKLTKYGGDSPLTVARIDVAGGAALFDVTKAEWRLYGTFGSQQFTEGAALPLLDRWGAVSITLEKSGKIVVSYNGDQRIHHIDVKAAPVDIAVGKLDLGLSQPPTAFDVETIYDDVVCSSK